jgi:metallo-beta-lactamase family protein
VDDADFVKIRGKGVDVKAKTHTLSGLSAHGDQDGLVRWFSSFHNRPSFYLVHGEIEFGLALKNRFEEVRNLNVAETGLKIELLGL